MADQVVRVGVAVIIQRGWHIDHIIFASVPGKILFGLRKGTHGGGTWSLPGGHVEFGEEPIDTARREVREETGLQVGEIAVYPPCPYVNTHFRQTGKQYITLYFTAEYLGGEPKVTEPDKCEKWDWFNADKPPSPLFEPIDLGKLRLHRGS